MPGGFIIQAYYRKTIYLKTLNLEYVKKPQGTHIVKLEEKNGCSRILIYIEGLKVTHEGSYEVWGIQKNKLILIDSNPNLDGENYEKTVQISASKDSLSGFVLTCYPDIIMAGFINTEIPIEELHTLYVGNKLKSASTVNAEINLKEPIDYPEIESLSNGVEGENKVQQNSENKLSEENVVSEGHQENQRTSKESPSNSLEWIKKGMENRNDFKRIEELFNKNKRIQPFMNYKPVDEWISIDLSDAVFLPFDAWFMNYNIFLLNAYRRYKHLILGRNNDQNRLLLGIPGNYDAQEIIIADLCNLKKFLYIEKNHKNQEVKGYWVLETNI